CGDSRLQFKKPLINPRFRKPASSKVEYGAWSRRTRVLTTTASGGAGSVGPIELRFLVNSGGMVGNNNTRGIIMSTAAGTSARASGMTKDEKFVIFASSLGTVFEWYDFYLYATLAPFFASLFFSPGNDTAALLSAFATYAAGFLVRPFGALIFGRIGDLVGRKYTFLVTIVVM